MNGYELVDDFYVRCPSNVDQEGVTSGKTGPSHFKFKLPHPIILENTEDWYVALHELFVPKHHYNIYKPFNQHIFSFDFIDLEARKQEVERLEAVVLQYKDEWSGETAAQMKRKLFEARTSEPLLPNKSFKVSIPWGNYTCEEFVKTVNYQIKVQEMIVSEGGPLTEEQKLDRYHLAQTFGDNGESQPKRFLSFDKTTAIFQLTIQPGDIVTFGHKRMQDLLGLIAEKPRKSFIPLPNRPLVVLKNTLPEMIKHTRYNSHKPATIRFPRTCDLDAENRHIYIYADVIKPSRVGDSFSPLLRIVNLSEANADLAKTGMTHKEFKHRQYFPVIESRIINNIGIEMRTGTGDLFPFKGGTSILDLHFAKFKKKRPELT